MIAKVTNEKQQCIAGEAERKGDKNKIICITNVYIGSR